MELLFSDITLAETPIMVVDEKYERNRAKRDSNCSWKRLMTPVAN